MANESTTCTVVTSTLLGAVITPTPTIASSNTCTIQCTTAQGALDMATLQVRIYASTNAVTPVLAAGTRWSGIGAGAKTLTQIASTASAIIGGQDFEGTRFLNTAGTIVFTFTGAGAQVEAYQEPRSTE